MAKLSVVGEYRYSNQEDDTTIAPYGQVGAITYSNQRVHREVNNGKLEATYRFPYAIQGTAGWGFESIDRGGFTPTASYSGVSALREETDETTWFLQVRRNMTETVSGLLSYSFSQRDGSDWLAPGASGVGLVRWATRVPNSARPPSTCRRSPTAIARRSACCSTWAATDALSAAVRRRRRPRRVLDADALRAAGVEVRPVHGRRQLRVVRRLEPERLRVDRQPEDRTRRGRAATSSPSTTMRSTPGSGSTAR